MGLIHRLVQAHILETNGDNIIAELILPGLGRADIVDTSLGLVWEIKHAGTAPYWREVIATIQAFRYVGGYQAGVYIHGLGHAGEFNGWFLIYWGDYTYKVTYWTPSDGVILYSVKEVARQENANATVYAYDTVTQKRENHSSAQAFLFIPIMGGSGSGYCNSKDYGAWGASKFNYSFI